MDSKQSRANKRKGATWETDLVEYFREKEFNPVERLRLSGTNKIKATKGGKTVQFAKRTKLSCDKNHVTGVETEGKLIMTAHGFIHDDKKAIDKYKKDHASEWLQTLGTTDFDLVEEAADDSKDIFDASETE